MSDHRADNIMLPSDKSRCEPMNPCNQKEHCARYRAPVPRMGSMMGFNIPMSGYPCYYFISVDSLRNARPTPEWRLHDAPAGRL